MEKIVFFVQTKKPIGGSQVLFLDFASYISRNYPDKQVFYINYSNPKVEKLYGSSNLNFCDVDKCDYSQFADAVFFTPLNYVFYLMAKIKNFKNARICLYFYHPQILDWLSMQNWHKTTDYTSMFNLLIETKGYCFMDSSNLLAAERSSDLNWDETFVPVTLHSEPKPYVKRPYNKNGRINIGWLGRLDYDKIYSVTNLADNLIALDVAKGIDFHIIGDGNAKHLIKLAKYCPKIRFIFTSYLYGEERDLYLTKNVDIAVAMGISALDVAQLGIPTILPIVSGEHFRDDKYYYLFNTKGYSLGWNRNDALSIGAQSNTIESIINDIYVDNLKQQYGEKCYEYSTNEFDLTNGTNMLLDALSRTEMTVEKCLKCPLIGSTIHNFELYKSLRKRTDFESFHEFNARIKRINLENGLRNKLKRAIKEVRRTLNSNKGNKQ